VNAGGGLSWQYQYPFSHVKRNIYFLANVNSRYISSSIRLLSVCLLSVTFVHPTQAVEIFGNVSMPFGTLAILLVQNLRRQFRGTPPSGVKCKKVAKYSDFGPFEGYISETVQNMTYKVVQKSGHPIYFCYNFSKWTQIFFHF